MNSVAKPEPPGAANFKAAPDPEPIFWSVVAESRKRLLKVAPAPAGSFRNAKRKICIL